jgi:imidazolonepropionase-like amidohydrolase
VARPVARWAYVNARLVDPGAGRLDGGLLIEGDRIVATGPDVDARSVGEGTTTVDLGGRTVLPGLIDCHAHLTWSADATPVATIIAETGTPALDRRAEENARRALERGVTTVRDLGGPNEIFGLRDRIARGDVVGPTIVASGAVITSPGGHCHFVGREVSTPEEIAEAVGMQIAAGADVIKIMATGGFHTAGTDPRQMQFSADDLRVAAEIAHAADVPITAHATTDRAIRAAAEAGFDSIQHGAGIRRSTSMLLARLGTALVPTLGTRPAFLRHADDPRIPPEMHTKTGRLREDRFATTGAAFSEGVTILVGTDSGTTFVEHGSVPDEMAHLERAGLDPVSILRAATSAAAHELRADGRIGTLAPGAFADLLIVDGDPLADLAALAAIHAVVRAGVLVAGPAVRLPSSAS